jgi:uncharacterized repeat protein (TIGR03803 family)
MLSVAAARADAQVFSPLYDFPSGGGNGNQPYMMVLTQATDGNFYGITRFGGVAGGPYGGYGTAYKITPSGSFTLLYDFCQQADCADGSYPYGGVVQASDGNFYGTTYSGGTYNAGTIFRLTANGVLTTLYNFCWYPNTCSTYSGGAAEGPLMQASNGDLYGTTSAGSVFKISLKGKFSLLDTLSSTGGSNGGLVQLDNGDLYGTTVAGGANSEGSIFKMSLSGKLTTLYSFCTQAQCADGSHPVAGLVQGADGDLYGTTFSGGASYGTVFKITTKGAFTSLVSFQAGSEPANPSAPLTLASDGTLYGTSQNGGANENSGNPGTVFQIANGTLTNVFPLTGGCVGEGPTGGILQSTSGMLYSTSPGTFGCGDGTLFQLDNGLPPFVQPIPAYGKPSAKIIIQGTNLTGASSVTFKGKAASFTVVSASEIQAIVPEGAKSGPIDVTTPSGTLASNVAFTVLK